ncbi:MAG: hypothetical protein Tsb0019_24660 [Roseibium sp.]
MLLAVLLALNITPGPLLFTRQPDVVRGLIETHDGENPIRGCQAIWPSPRWVLTLKNKNMQMKCKFLSARRLLIRIDGDCFDTNKDHAANGGDRGRGAAGNTRPGRNLHNRQGTV